MTGAVQLGPFPFRFSERDVAAYRGSLGYAAGNAVPVAFAARALTEPGVVAAMMAVFAGRIPIHLTQSFEVSEGLLADCDYAVALELTELANGRMKLAAAITRVGGKTPSLVLLSELAVVSGGAG